MNEYQDLVKWLSYLLGTQRRVSAEEVEIVYRTTREIFSMMDRVDE